MRDVSPRVPVSLAWVYIEPDVRSVTYTPAKKNHVTSHEIAQAVARPPFE